MRKGTAVLALMLWFIVGAAARADDAPDPQMQLWLDDLAAARREHAQALASEPDARSKLAAALLLSFDAFALGRVDESTMEMQRWLDEAVALAPDDPLIAWAQLHACTGAETCRRDDALRRLQRIEPDNALVWMFAAGAAGSSGQEAERARHEQRMLEATDYTNPYLPLARVIYAAWRSVPVPSADGALRAKLGARLNLDLSAGDEAASRAYGFGATLALGIPSYQPLIQACLPERHPVADIESRVRCIALFERLVADEDLLIAPTLGLSSLVRLHDDDRVAQARWREDYRRFLWQFEEAGRLHKKLPLAYFLAGNYSERYIADGELAAMRWLLGEHGVPLDPPTNWLPSQPRHRSLVVEGREPD